MEGERHERHPQCHSEARNLSGDRTVGVAGEASHLTTAGGRRPVFASRRSMGAGPATGEGHPRHVRRPTDAGYGSTARRPNQGRG